MLKLVLPALVAGVAALLPGIGDLTGTYGAHPGECKGTITSLTCTPVNGASCSVIAQYAKADEGSRWFIASGTRDCAVVLNNADCIGTGPGWDASCTPN